MSVSMILFGTLVTFVIVGLLSAPTIIREWRRGRRTPLYRLGILFIVCAALAIAVSAAMSAAPVLTVIVLTVASFACCLWLAVAAHRAGRPMSAIVGPTGLAIASALVGLGAVLYLGMSK